MFKDPIKIKNQRPPFKPKNGVNSPWDFTCPKYDERTGSFIKAGTNYGDGYRQPVGSKGKTKTDSPTPVGNKEVRYPDE